MFMPEVFYELKKKNCYYFSKRKWKYFYTFNHFEVFKKSKIAQIYYYNLQSAGINKQSPQSDSTPWTLTPAFDQKSCCHVLKLREYKEKKRASIPTQICFQLQLKLTWPSICVFNERKIFSLKILWSLLSGKLRCYLP